MTSTRSFPSFLTLAKVVLLVALFGALVRNYLALRALKAEEKKAQEKVRQLEDINKKLKSDLLMTEDPTELEKKIRNTLGRQRPGETSFILPVSPSQTK